MEIKIHKLKLTNFKGIREFKILFDDTVTNVFGRNATGKTTLFDAYSWLLWDKDSVNRSDFGIKTYTQDGDTLHGIDHSVEGELSIDGKALRLKKIYSEKWTKKRGSADSEFTGHTTEYFVNEVSVKKKEYQDRINAIIQEDVFKLLSNPAHFSVALDKNKRREILMTLIRDVSDEDVIQGNPSLAELKPLIAEHQIDELKSMRKAQATKINKEIQELPIRIDELASSKKDLNFEELGMNLSYKKSEIEKIDNEILNENSVADTYFEKMKEIKDLENQLFVLKSQDESAKNETQLAKLKVLNEKKNQLAQNDYKIQSTQDAIKRQDMLIDSFSEEARILNVEIENLKEDYVTQAKAEYVPSPEDLNCPTCGQPIPQDKQAEIKSNFNQNKAKKLEKITETAMGKKGMIKRKEEESSSAKEWKNSLERELENLKNEKRELEEELSKLDASEETVELKNPEMVLLEEKIKSKKSALDVMEKPNTEELKQRKSALSTEVTALENQLVWQEENKKIDEKIQQYKNQEKELSGKYAQCEKVLFLLEEFTKTKVTMISGKINNLFQTVEFKLFDTQINGGIVETCEATIHGVPFSDANNAARINAGIDIINTLTKEYGISAPIFVDNAESVNNLLYTDSQVVRLVVSEDSELTVR